MRKNFTPEQMLHTVRQAESGTPVAEVCRKLGITEQTFYKWKRRVAGMGIAELAIAYDGSDGSQAALEDLQLAGLGKNVKVTIRRPKHHSVLISLSPPTRPRKLERRMRSQHRASRKWVPLRMKRRHVCSLFPRRGKSVPKCVAGRHPGK